MTRKPAKLRESEPERIEAELADAYDFDPADPMFGLAKDEMSGAGLSRRVVLRLMAAAGSLTAWHLLAGGGVRPAAAAAGGELRAGWTGAGEIRTLDPAQINQVLQSCGHQLR